MCLTLGIRRTYIQGNPGMGKSTYSRKITLDWCKNVARRFDSQEIQEEDQSSIQGLDFEFLFLLSLRESDGGACDVMQMIINGIISQISYKHYDDDFLANVLNCERCLVILDGLDEWSHPLNGSCTKTPKHIPHRNRVGKSIYLTMTRPWKLSQISLKDSEIDVLIEISGVKETDELITKVVTCLNNNEAKTKDSKQFNKATEHLSSIKTIPIVVLQLICIWYEKNTVPESQCGIYSTMMKMLLQRKKDDGNAETQIASVVVPNCISDIQWSESEWKFLMQLGKLAFETLYPLDRKLPRLVFTDDLMSRYVNNETKGFGLSAGILTEYKIRSLNAKKSHLSFLHKTFQEFLASFYLSFQQGENLVVRMNNEGFNIDDISQMFLFLCGLKPSLAVTVFSLLMRKTSQLIYNCLVKDKQEFDIISIVHNAMNIMKSGHMESVQNGHANVRFTLTHICFANDTYNVSSTGESFTDSKIGKLETIICTEEEFNLQASSIVKLNSNTLKTIWLRKIDDHVELSECTYLQAIIIVGNTFDRPGYVDMSIDENVQNVPVYLNISKCNGLKHLVIAQLNVTMEINTDQLYSCRLRNYDLSKGNIAETLEHRSSRIRYLYLEYCSAANSAEGRRFKLDLISCSCLQKLYIAFCDFAFRIGTTNLKECELYDYDFLHGHIAEDLKNAKSLTQLTLSDCKATLGNGEKNPAFILDLTSCSSLQWIYVSWCDIAVSINTTALRECYLSGHNLAQGNLLEALSKSTQLTVLKIWRCSFPETDQRHIKKVSLDMSACKNLSVLMIQNSDVIMSYNTQIVGERLITWTNPLV